MTQDYFRVRVFERVRVAIPLPDVEGVYPVTQKEICPIPGVQSYLLGVVNRRGTLTWVLDLSQFLGLSSVSIQPSQNLKTLVCHPGDSSKENYKRSLACVVAQLEGMFTSVEQKPLTKRLKPRIQPLFLGLSYHDQQWIPIVNPAAMFQTIQTESIRAVI